jgi:hypothetical protein
MSTQPLNESTSKSASMALLMSSNENLCGLALLAASGRWRWLDRCWRSLWACGALPLWSAQAGAGHRTYHTRGTNSAGYVWSSVGTRILVTYTLRKNVPVQFSRLATVGSVQRASRPPNMCTP